MKSTPASRTRRSSPPDHRLGPRARLACGPTPLARELDGARGTEQQPGAELRARAPRAEEHRIEERGDAKAGRLEPPAQRGHDGIDVAVLLELDVGVDPPGDHLEGRLEPRRLRAAEAHGQLGIVELAHAHAADPLVVDEHEQAIAGAPDIELDHLAAERDRVLERRE